MKLDFLILLVLSFFSCNNPEKTIIDPPLCTIDANLRFYTQDEMTATFRNDIIEKLATSNQTDAAGALDRNKTAYFHVRFQMGISPLADYAVDAQNSTALEMVVRAIEYSFKYQMADGDFQLVIPPDLINTAVATEGDKVSGIAFFYSALGSGLLALQENSGYQAQLSSKQRIEILIPQYQLTLNFLKSKATILKQIDANAPNRLLLDALAFYSMGQYLNDKNAMSIGIDFANLALAKKQPEGYFLEGTGYDSSYQGVGIAIGFRLLSVLKSDEPIRQILYNNLACATRWEMTRLKPNGEINTQGNSRVYAGGETFLGKEKQVAYTSVIVALWNMYYYSGKEEYNDVANMVLAFYQ